MFQVFLYGLSLMTMIGTCHSRLAMRNNEWTPLTNEEVHARSRITIGGVSVIHIPSKYREKTDVKHKDENMIRTASFPVNEETADLHDLRSKAIKVVPRGATLQFHNENIFTPIEPETIQSVNELQNTEEDCIKQDCKKSQENTISAGITKENNIETMQDHVNDLNQRKSKAILEVSSINDIKNDKDNSGPVDDNVHNFQRRITKDIGQTDNAKQYKVKEDDNEPLEDGVGVDSRESGYFYPRPDLHLNRAIPNNLTDNFLNILSKHNIKPEDELLNYNISRRTTFHDPINTFMFIPIPLKVLPQFNNFKQLSVNPLLAVLMSNYGYYFPGSYGIHSRYRNLYGHLASNNIHNNKPFGSYKIFADTDSYN